MKQWFRPANILIAIASLIISCGIWLYVVAVQNPDAEITLDGLYPTFSDEADLEARNLVIRAGQNTEVTLTLRGPRTELVALQNQGVKITVSSARITSAGEYDLAYRIEWPDGSIKNVTVLDRKPFYIRVTADSLSTRVLDIKPILQGEISEGYTGGTWKVEPATVQVSGPAKVLETLSHAKAVLVRGDVTQSVSDTVPLTLIDGDGNVADLTDLSLDPANVVVTYEILKEKTVPLTIEILEGGGATKENAHVTIDPMSITIAGNAADIDAISSITVGSFDLSKIVESAHEEFPILLPTGVVNRTGTPSVTVDLSITGLTVANRDATQIQILNPPSGLSVTPITELMTVTVRGTPDAVAMVSGYNLRVVVDLAGVELALGSQSVPARVLIDGPSGVGVVGEYNVSLTVTQIRAASGPVANMLTVP